MCVCVYVHVRSDAAETVIHSADAFAPVGYLRFTEMHTESKDAVSQLFLKGISAFDFSAEETLNPSLKQLPHHLIKSNTVENTHEDKTF